MIITDDTRECREGTLFVVTGSNEHYHDQAVAKKAQLISPAEVMARFLPNPPAIIGITGTNGKTTTAAAIYSILLDLGYKAALLGTRGFFCNDEKLAPKGLTTPQFLETFAFLLEAKARGCDYFVMEVSSHAIVQRRIEALPFALKVHTNITQDHLDFHKTFENYREVKRSFFTDDSLKLINVDDPEITFNPKNASSYGIEKVATFKVDSYTLRDGIGAVVRFHDEMATIDSELVGFFNLYNLVAALAAVKLVTKRSLEEIARALENFGGVSGRMEIVSTNPMVIVDFAHTPDGMAKVIEAMKEREVIVLFGAGGDRDADKRPKMGHIAATKAKRVYVTSDNPRSEDPHAIIEQIMQGVPSEFSERVHVIVDRREAIGQALRELQEDEVLLILGKGDETTQIIGGVEHPFDDRDVVRSFLSSNIGGIKS
ncbi:MAG: UDP-N-acetylmuramoyl-L-alanyl-D-glutamate--2,6-diaminopimelate ligase [Campylobacterales bacterium]